MLDFNTLDDFDFNEKTVLLRVDFNLPLDKETLDILDTTRIEKSLPTINELIEKNAKIVIIAHQGRPGSWDFTSLDKHARALSNILGKNVKFIDGICEDRAIDAIRGLKPGEVLMLENVRNLPYEMEKKDAKEHAKTELIQKLSKVADIFVNDAFSAAHRKQCSLIGFTVVMPSCAGRLMEKEIRTLEKVLKNPERPNVFLFGGAKYSDVVKTVKRALEEDKVDYILLAGLPGNAFLKVNGYDLGRINEEMLSEEWNDDLAIEMRDILKRFFSNLVLPRDFGIEVGEKRREISIDDLPTSYPIYDIGDETVSEFIDIIKKAKTIFLSGPCGVFEKEEFMKGTEKVFRAIAESGAFSVAGGGHTIAALEKLGLSNKISHISTGGGSLEKFMMGEKLPVIEALKAAKR